MTPWDVITADTPPAGVAVLALTQLPQGGADWEDIQGAVGAGPAGALTWTDAVTITPDLMLAARPARLLFNPSPGGDSSLVQAVALVDMGGGPKLLALFPVQPPTPLSVLTGPLVLTALVVVQGQQ